MALPGNGSKLREFIYITPSRETARGPQAWIT